MESFKQFMLVEVPLEKVAKQIELFEHKVYKRMPGSINSYREDPGKVNTMTLRHSHVYAKPQGKGKELYSVNINGTGHDGSSGRHIPAAHARHFRGIGYTIPANNILESLELNNLASDGHKLFVMEIAE